MSGGRQARSAEIKHLSLINPAVGSHLVAPDKKMKQRSSSCAMRRSSNGVDSYETCLVRKMFGQFREVVKTDGDEEKEEKRKEIEKIRLARYCNSLKIHFNNLCQIFLQNCGCSKISFCT